MLYYIQYNKLFKIAKMPDAPANKNSKKEIEHSPDIPDFIIPEKTEISQQVPQQELEKGREAVKKEISEQQETAKKPKQVETPVKIQPSTSIPSPLPRHQAGVTSAIKSPELIQIENILEDDLSEAFKTMDKAMQMRFKQEGERTASKIEQVLHQAKTKVKEILSLIRNWLRIIPGANKFFVEQETKIKVDKIMALKK